MTAKWLLDGTLEVEFRNPVEFYGQHGHTIHHLIFGPEEVAALKEVLIAGMPDADSAVPEKVAGWKPPVGTGIG